MKSFFVSIILVLTFCVGTSAQKNETSPCPTIEITEPAGIIEYDKVVTYIANVSKEVEKFDVNYQWSVKDGEIVEGQGTSVIRAKWANFVDGFTVYLVVEGLPENCHSTASSTVACQLRPEPIETDNYSISELQIDKERLDVLAQQLQNDPTAIAYIIEKFERKVSSKIIRRKNQKIIKYLKFKGIMRNQFELLNASADKNLTLFFVVPAGASRPTCDDCIIFQPE